MSKSMDVGGFLLACLLPTTLTGLLVAGLNAKALYGTLFGFGLFCVIATLLSLVPDKQ